MLIVRAIDVINETVGRIASFLAIFFASVIIYDVTMRYFFGQPSRWAFDVSKQLYGFYFILLGGYALKHGAHVSIDLLINKLEKGWRTAVLLLGYAIFFVPFALVFVQTSYDFAMRSFNSGETTYSAVQIPVYPLKIALAISAVLLLLQGIAEILRYVLRSESAR